MPLSTDTNQRVRTITTYSSNKFCCDFYLFILNLIRHRVGMAHKNPPFIFPGKQHYVTWWSINAHLNNLRQCKNTWHDSITPMPGCTRATSLFVWDWNSALTNTDSHSFTTIIGFSSCKYFIARFMTNAFKLIKWWWLLKLPLGGDKSFYT